MKKLNLTGALKKAADRRKKEGNVDEYTFVNARYFPTAEEFTSQILMSSTTVEVIENMKGENRVMNMNDTIPLDFNESETVEYVCRMIADILHDGESKRGSAKLTISGLFTNDENGLHAFVRMLVIGMINTYKEEEVPAAPSRKRTRLQGGGSQMIEPTDEFIDSVVSYMRDNRWVGKVGFKTNEAVIMQSAKDELETSPIVYTQIRDDTTTRKISADDVAFNSKYPMEYIYDAGSQLQASDIAKFPSIHISLINFLDQGDSLRDRNQLISALRAYAETITTSVKATYGLAGKQMKKKRFVEIFKDFFVNDHEKTFIERCQTFYDVSTSVNLNPYIFIGFIQSYLETQRRSIFTPQYPDTIQEVCNEFEAYVQHIIDNGIGSSEQYIIHNNNVNIILTGVIPLKNGGKQKVSLLDVKYELVADTAKGARQIPLISLGKRFEAYESFSANNVVTLLHNHEFFDSSTINEQNCMKLYAACMMKFIGDFCQLIYAFYLGAVFGSFDRATVGMAFFIMSILVKDPARYAAFKDTKAAPPAPAAAAAANAPATRKRRIQGSGITSSSPSSVSAVFPQPDPRPPSSSKSTRTAATERIQRGIVIADSVTYRGNSIPSLTYHLDKNAFNNITAYNEGIGENNTECVNFREAMRVQKAAIRKALIKYAKTVGASYIAYKSAPKYKKQACQAIASAFSPPPAPLRASPASASKAPVFQNSQMGQNDMNISPKIMRPQRGKQQNSGEIESKWKGK